MRPALAALHATRYGDAMRAAALLFAGALVLAGADHAWPKPSPCPPGVFVLDAASAAAVGALLGMPAPTIDLATPGRVRVAGCEATAKLKAKAKATKLSAKLPSCGTAARVKLRGRIAAPACAQLRGAVKAKRARKVAIAADRDAGTSTTSTTLPAFCGNGVRDGADQCEGHDGCAAGQRCTAECTCETVPAPPTRSAGLIAAALAAGTIDYETSLVYRAWALFADSRLPPEYDGEAWDHEDNGLFREIASVWDTLSPGIQAELQPFRLRPTEPGSYWSPTSMLVPPAGAASPEPIECPFQPGAGERDWRYTASDHFVVWSCGGGNAAQDPYAAQRAITAGVAEAVYAAMTGPVGPPEPDTLVAGPAPTTRTDIYLLETHRCKVRDNVCVPIPVDEETGEPALAAVAGTAPCRAQGRLGRAASSSFIVVDVAQVTPAATPWSFRYTMAHEYFHLLQNALNLEAQGGGCTSDNTVDDTVGSWFVEASAEWAAWAFFAADGAADRDAWFRAFQQRDAALTSLRSLEGQRPYEAYIYPFFVQQEKNGNAQPVIDVWKGSGGARNPEQLDDRLNAALPFADHFRDFGVRNFNRMLAGSPVAPPYQAVSGGAIPPEVPPIVIQPDVRLDFPGEFPRPVRMEALTAQYEHFLVHEHVRWVQIDLQGIDDFAYVRADVLAKVGGTWERIEVPADTFEFCRDDKDISELYLILSHHDRRPGARAEGTYRTETRLDCPGGWTGSIRYVQTMTEQWTRVVPNVGTYSFDEYEREDHHWTVVGSEEKNPFGQPYEELELRWHGRLERTAIDNNSPVSCISDVAYGIETLSGSGSGTDHLNVNAAGGGAYGFAPFPNPEGNQFPTTGSYDYTLCTGDSGSTPHAGARNDPLGLIAAIAAFGIQQPDPMDPKRFAGSATLLHHEQAVDGGYEVIDGTFSWDLRRRR